MSCRACPAERGTGSRSQILMEATSTVPRQTKSRLSNRAATARFCRELAACALDGVALLVSGGVKGGGRNRRWVRGTARHPRQSPKWRRFLADHQNPFATVVSCIDSRVPPEIVFDCGLGEMFVIRTGAQTLDDQVVLGSIEFGPEFFPSARLMFVLGHQRCGAVGKAIGVIESGGRARAHPGRGGRAQARAMASGVVDIIA